MPVNGLILLINKDTNKDNWTTMRLHKHTYLLCIFFFSVHFQVWAINIKNIRIGDKKLFTRVVFDLSEKPDIYNIKYKTSPDRIILDFTKGSINQQAIKNTSAYSLIKKINGTNIRNNGFTVEIELQEAANFKHFVLPPTNKVGYRLVLDITPGEHRFTTAPQTIIPEAAKQKKKSKNNITNYKSDSIKLYDNKVLSDATIDQLFQPFLGNTQLKNPYYTPPLAEKIKTKKLTSNVPLFNIRGYKIKGNSLLNIDILKISIKPYTGKNKNFSDVQHALESLELAYKKMGYGMVQVYLPEQELDKGIIVFNVIEPKISTLTVQGANNFNLENIEKSIVSLKKGKTPNTRDIAKNLSLINENPAKKQLFNLSLRMKMAYLMLSLRSKIKHHQYFHYQSTIQEVNRQVNCVLALLISMQTLPIMMISLICNILFQKKVMRLMHTVLDITYRYMI